MKRDDLHAALCAALGIEPGHGSAQRVAEALEVSPQWYGRVRAGYGALDSVAKLANRAGLEVRIVDGRVSFR